MESHGELEHGAKLLPAQVHVWNHIFSFVNSFSLECAIELSIPDIINNYGRPMPLSKLIASLPVPPSKTPCIYRLMRILTHSGFFSQHNVTENELEIEYVLTDASMLLHKDNPLSQIPFLLLMLDPIMTRPWDQLSTWFKNDDPTAFYTENRTTVWDYLGHDPEFNHLFNDAMASDARLVTGVLTSDKCKGVFEGLESLVDVGGGTGTVATAIAKSFPQMECTVFDLPHVVDGLQGSDNLKYVGGDMFEAIPPADVLFFKWIMHDWNDDECVKILKNCKEAIASKGKEGKVIIIDMVVENEKGDNEPFATQFFFDMVLMVSFTGKERTKKEWAKLFFSAGFSDYKITPVLGLRSLIEVYP